MPDLEVVGDFLFRNVQCKYYRLYFKDGTQIIAEFLTCADSDNGLELDDPYYEDLYEFYFIVKKIEKGGSAIDSKRRRTSRLTTIFFRSIRALLWGSVKLRSIKPFTIEQPKAFLVWKEVF